MSVCRVSPVSSLVACSTICRYATFIPCVRPRQLQILLLIPLPHSSSSFLFLIPHSSFLFLLQVFLEGSPTYDVACDIRANPLPRPHMITWRSRAEGFDPLSPIRGRVINKRDFSMRAVADVRPFMQAAALRSHSFRCVREWKFCPVIYEQL